MSGAAQAAVLAAAVGSGLVAGVWFAFSGFVMHALARLPAPAGIAAMQSVNRSAVRPPLMAAVFGTAALCVGLAARAVVTWGGPGTALSLAGALVYLLGTIGVTVAANVPRNDRLAALDAEAPDAAERWAGYVAGWTAWNHVRLATSLLAAVLLTLAGSR